MAFQLPTFNIQVKIWTQATPPPAAARLQVQAQLRAAGKTSTGQDSLNSGWPFLWAIILPPRTDVRDAANASGSDIIEAPMGTARYYDVVYVDDVARDFLNEYRICFVKKRSPWPTPIT
jgi:hypothetical protein